MYNGGGVMPGRRAGSNVDKYNAEGPKQGSKRLNSITLGKLFIYMGHSDDKKSRSRNLDNVDMHAMQSSVKQAFKLNINLLIYFLYS